MAGAKFTMTPGLEQLVAQRFVKPVVDDTTEAVAGIAKDLAPGTKVWISVGDERVRPTHRRAHGQEVPENLRFTLKSMKWDQQHRGVGAYTYMLRPKDESAGACINAGVTNHGHNNCRCHAVPDPNGIAKLIDAQAALVVGKRVKAKVVCEGNLVLQAEYGDAYPAPGNPIAEGTYFMHRAVAAARARQKG